MAKQLYQNNAASTLNGTIASGATTLVLASGEGARFPFPSGGNYFLATIFEKDGSGVEENYEIVKVTARVADTLTIERDHEGTVAGAGGPSSGGLAYPTAPGRTVYVELRFTKAGADNFLQAGDLGVIAQAYDADLAWLAANITTAGLSFLAEATAADQRDALGLGSVNNTADADKPISASAAVALAGKASLAGNTFTGNQNLDGHHLQNVKTATFSAEHDAGSSGATPSIDFSNGKFQKITLTANATVTLTFPGTGHYQLRLIQDATGGRTWTNPAGTKAVGAALSINTAASSETILTYVSTGSGVYVAAGKVI